MIKKSFTILTLVMGICLFLSANLYADKIPGIQWNTFIGGTNNEGGNSITTDSSGNVYIVGDCYETSWGTPVNGHSGKWDAFVAKLDASGTVLWHTYIGGSGHDYGYDITTDGSGNVYITGETPSDWGGTPVNAYVGGDEAFVVKLDSNGNQLWHTYMGSSSADQGYSIISDSSGNVYVTGRSYATWGTTPVNGYVGGSDAFVANLDTNGNRQWNTFMGSTSSDEGLGITLDSSGNPCVTGESDATWGSPVNGHAGNADLFVAKLSSLGARIWNTFLGGSSDDGGNDITADGSGSVYVTGGSYVETTAPLGIKASTWQIVVARFTSGGSLSWSTYLGGATDDVGYSITLDSNGRLNIAGYSNCSWGDPINPYEDDWDIVVAQLKKNNGNLIWNTFLGNSTDNYGYGITSDGSGSVYVAGTSYGDWGDPLNSNAGNDDACCVKITPQITPDIMANGSDKAITLDRNDVLKIEISLVSFGRTNSADWWVLAETPFGWYHYKFSTGKWEKGKTVARQANLEQLDPMTVFNKSGLKVGTYKFYFGVDLTMDGSITMSSLVVDKIKVTITSI
jgi:hypothetical protein